MTQQEHLLIIGMLAQQMQLSLMLLEMLKSRKVVTQDDVSAFASIIATDDVIALVGRMYENTARKLGLEVRLPAEPA